MRNSSDPEGTPPETRGFLGLERLEWCIYTPMCRARIEGGLVALAGCPPGGSVRRWRLVPHGKDFDGKERDTISSPQDPRAGLMYILAAGRPGGWGAWGTAALEEPAQPASVSLRLPRMFRGRTWVLPWCHGAASGPQSPAPRALGKRWPSLADPAAQARPLGGSTRPCGSAQGRGRGALQTSPARFAKRWLDTRP